MIFMNSVTIRKKHFGLQKQWLKAWKPNAWNEFAFIFEDDVEVSPYFYLYGKQAVETYYMKTIETPLLHAVILDHIQKQVQQLKKKWNIQEPYELNKEQRQSILDGNMWDFTKILLEYAGIPALYGICLQRKVHSPLRYPERLRVSSAARPYLYSMVGSWGPIMFPMIWKAFSIWWEWTIAIDPDYVHSFNKNFNGKADLWTPYFTG
jgi:hypothetical protein